MIPASSWHQIPVRNRNTPHNLSEPVSRKKHGTQMTSSSSRAYILTHWTFHRAECSVGTILQDISLNPAFFVTCILHEDTWNIPVPQSPCRIFYRLQHSTTLSYITMHNSALPKFPTSQPRQHTPVTPYWNIRTEPNCRVSLGLRAFAWEMGETNSLSYQYRRVHGYAGFDWCTIVTKTEYVQYTSLTTPPDCQRSGKCFAMVYQRDFQY